MSNNNIQFNNVSFRVIRHSNDNINEYNGELDAFDDNSAKGAFKVACKTSDDEILYSVVEVDTLTLTLADIIEELKRCCLDDVKIEKLKFQDYNVRYFHFIGEKKSYDNSSNYPTFVDSQNDIVICAEYDRVQCEITFNVDIDFIENDGESNYDTLKITKYTNFSY